MIQINVNWPPPWNTLEIKKKKTGVRSGRDRDRESHFAIFAKKKSNKEDRSTTGSTVQRMLHPHKICKPNLLNGWAGIPIPKQLEGRG